MRKRELLPSVAAILLGLGQSLSGIQSPLIGVALMLIGAAALTYYALTTESVKRRAPFVIARNPRRLTTFDDRRSELLALLARETEAWAALGWETAGDVIVALKAETYQRVAAYDVGYAAEWSATNPSLRDLRAKLEDIMRAVRTHDSHLAEPRTGTT
jgi:hypothetical protein